MVDSGQEITEIDESNNHKGVNISVPDLEIIEIIASPTNPAAGDDVQWKITIKNHGPGNSMPFEISFDKDNEHIVLPYIPYNLEKIIIGESKKKLADLNIVMVIQELLLCLQDLHKNNINTR